EPVTSITDCVSMIDGSCLAGLLRSVYRSAGASASSWKGAATMRLGLLADIHEAIVPLQEAIDLFQQARVDEVVVLGDICRMHHQLEMTVQMLRQAGAVGVWGNHDFGLCRATDEDVRQRFAPEVLAFMATLRPALVRDDCLLSHVEPWLDANDLYQLWYFEGPPDTPQKLARNFAAVPERVLISGHVHRWFLATPDGRIDWDGDRPINLARP